MDFEGIANGSNPGSFYTGIEFQTNVSVLKDSDAGGTGNFANEPSPSSVMFFGSGSSCTMNVADGFTEYITFWFSTIFSTGQVRVYSGLNATGSLLGSFDCDALGAVGSGDPTGDFVKWEQGFVEFAGTALSVVFAGTANEICFDDVEIGPAP